MIQVGQKLPDAKLKGVGAHGVEEVNLHNFLSNKKVIIFGVPGAFTPLCSKTHVPSFMQNAPAFRRKGIDCVVCVAVNDPFVLEAWKKELGVQDDVFFLADGNGTWLKSLGLTFDASSFGLGERAQRFAMVIEDGVLKLLEIEKNPGACDVSSGEAVLEKV